MSYIPAIPEEDATGELKRIYNDYLNDRGYIPNYASALSPRIEVFEAWRNLEKSIKTNMSFRTYELVTLAAASSLKSTYCMLSHGVSLGEDEFESEQVEAIARDYKSAGLSPAEVAIMEFTDKLVQNAPAIMQADVDRLRDYGFTDVEIMDIVLAGAARCFYSKMLDALDVEPDDMYLELDESLRNALTVGRPFPR